MSSRRHNRLQVRTPSECSLRLTEQARWTPRLHRAWSARLTLRAQPSFILSDESGVSMHPRPAEICPILAKGPARTWFVRYPRTFLARHLCAGPCVSRGNRWHSRGAGMRLQRVRSERTPRITETRLGSTAGILRADIAYLGAGRCYPRPLALLQSTRGRRWRRVWAIVAVPWPRTRTRIPHPTNRIHDERARAPRLGASTDTV